MSFYRSQLFSKKDIDGLLENNLIEYNSRQNTSIEKEFWPGREVKLCLVENGVATWVPGRDLTFSGTNEKCNLQVILNVVENIHFIIVLYDTTTVLFDSSKEI